MTHNKYKKLNSLACYRLLVMSYKSREAFTLMELLVATSLFIIIATITTGAFVQSLRTERTIVVFTTALNNVTQSIEQMSREIRTGSDFSNSDADNLNFINYKGHPVSYRLLSAAKVIGRCEGSLCINALDSQYQPITSDKIKIDTMKFYYLGTGETGSITNPADNLPPRITITIAVEGIQGAVINLQTSVSPYAIGS